MRLKEEKATPPDTPVLPQTPVVAEALQEAEPTSHTEEIVGKTREPEGGSGDSAVGVETANNPIARRAEEPSINGVDAEDIQAQQDIPQPSIEVSGSYRHHIHRLIALRRLPLVKNQQMRLMRIEKAQLSRMVMEKTRRMIPTASQHCKHPILLLWVIWVHYREWLLVVT